MYIITFQFCFLGIAVSPLKDCINLAFFAPITATG